MPPFGENSQIILEKRILPQVTRKMEFFVLCCWELLTLSKSALWVGGQFKTGYYCILGARDIEPSVHTAPQTCQPERLVTHFTHIVTKTELQNVTDLTDISVRKKLIGWGKKLKRILTNQAFFGKSYVQNCHI